jgi:Leucine Rich repeats (2 copies)
MSLSLEEAHQRIEKVRASGDTSLFLFDCPELTDLGPLAGLDSLETLELCHNAQLTDLGPLATLGALKLLYLSHCTRLSGLRPLAGLKELQILSLSGCEQLSDLTPLAGLTSLQDLSVARCPKVSDLTPLAGLTALRVLDVAECPQVTDLSPLAGLQNLAALCAADTGVRSLPAWVLDHRRLERFEVNTLTDVRKELQSAQQGYNCLSYLRSGHGPDPEKEEDERAKPEAVRWVDRLRGWWGVRGKKRDPFTPLRSILIEAIPQAVAALRAGESLCALRICCYDTHAPCAYLQLRTISEECRRGVVSKHGRDAPYYLWAAGENCGEAKTDLPPTHPFGEAHQRMQALFAVVYELLCEDESGAMAAYRKMLQEVATELNAKDWKQLCSVTDDFVVAPADGSQHFADDFHDLVNSIPADRLTLLRSRGLLGPPGRWSQLP